MQKSCWTFLVVLAVNGALPAAASAAAAQTGNGTGAGPADRTTVEPVPAMPGTAAGMLKEAQVLCDKLAGVEREVCIRQAQENHQRALSAGVGAGPDASGGGSVSDAQRERAPGGSP